MIGEQPSGYGRRLSPLVRVLDAANSQPRGKILGTLNRELIGLQTLDISLRRRLAQEAGADRARDQPTRALPRLRSGSRVGHRANSPARRSPASLGKARRSADESEKRLSRATSVLCSLFRAPLIRRRSRLGYGRSACLREDRACARSCRPRR